MFDFTDYVVALIGVLVAVPAAYISAKKRVEAELEKRLKRVEADLEERLKKISGNRISTIEDLVAEALTDKRLREDTPIAVYGSVTLWKELRNGGFASSFEHDKLTGEAKVAVVNVERVEENVIRKLTERYVLLYKEGPQYQGPKPPGSLVTYANSSITLDGRLMEALRHMDARSEASARSA